MLPAHGMIRNCTGCGLADPQWGAVRGDDKWHLEYNPCSWGSTNPEVIVLGFSKGPNQSDFIESLPFDEIPFRRMRDNLTRVLRKIELLDETETVDEKITSNETRFAFGSLIRCSLSQKDKKTGEFKKSGNNIMKFAMREDIPRTAMANCARRFLGDLPNRTRLVVLLGSGAGYPESCMEIIKSVHPNIRWINAVSYGNNQVTFVHVPHPVGSNNGQTYSWLKDAGREAGKQELAREAVRNALP